MDQQQTPEIQTSEQSSSPEPIDKQPRFNKRKKILALVCFLLIGAAAGAYLMWRNEPPVDNSSTDHSEPKSEDEPAQLIYSTKNGKTTSVHILNVDENKTKQEIKFDELYPFDASSGNLWEGQKPSVDATSDGSALAYTTASKNLIFRNVETDKEETIVKGTDTNQNNGGSPVIKIEPEPPTSSGPDYLSISSPVVSRNGQHVGFSIGRYEGSSVAVINRQTKSYIALGDTFRYVSEDGIPEKFTLINDTKPLAQMGIFGSHLVKEWGYLNEPLTTLDGKRLLVVLCPLNLPSTGDSQYLESAFSDTELAGYKSQRDCGESGELTVISIDLATGSHQEVGKGNFGRTLAVNSKNDVFVAGNQAAGFNVTHLDLSGTKPAKAIDINGTSNLKQGDSIKHVTVKNLGNRPIAEVYVVNGNEQSVKVVDLVSKKVVTSITLAQNTGYNTLSLVNF